MPTTDRKAGAYKLLLFVACRSQSDSSTIPDARRLQWVYETPVLRLISCRVDRTNDWASLSMGRRMATYIAAPRRVKATVVERRVGWGITNITIAIMADARVYFKMLDQGIEKGIHLRAMAYLASRLTALAHNMIRVR